MLFVCFNSYKRIIDTLHLSSPTVIVVMLQKKILLLQTSYKVTIIQNKYYTSLCIRILFIIKLKIFFVCSVQSKFIHVSKKINALSIFKQTSKHDVLFPFKTTYKKNYWRVVALFKQFPDEFIPKILFS